MKEAIHPKYHEVEARCACGATWKTRSTKPELHLEICSNCHPFFTGRQKLIDTEGRVERFTKKFGAQTSESRKKAAAQRRRRRRRPPSRSRRRQVVVSRQSSVAGRQSQVEDAVRVETGDCRLTTLQLPLDPRQPMPSGLDPGRRHPVFQTLQRKRLRRRQDRARDARGESRALRSPRARSTAGSRRRRAAAASTGGGSRTAARGATAHASARSGIARHRSVVQARVVLTAHSYASLRALVEARARVDAAERQRFARIARGGGAHLQQMQQPRRQARERQQIEPVVLENRGERPRVAGADELKIARGNFEAGHVACAPRAEHAAARARRANTTAEPLDPARRRHARPLRHRHRGAPRTRAPDAARRRAAAARRPSRGDERDSASRAAARRTTCR